MMLFTAAKEIDHIIRTFTVRLEGRLQWVSRLRDMAPLTTGWEQSASMPRCRDVTTSRTNMVLQQRKVLEAWPAHIETRPERRLRPSTCRHHFNLLSRVLRYSGRLEILRSGVSLWSRARCATGRGCAWDMQEPGLRDAAMNWRRLQAAGLPTIRWV
jgi:hypothetical protein